MKCITTDNEKIVAYKGFDINLRCCGFQFEIGKTFNHQGDARVCSSGFHACEYPLDVFGYYSPAESRFAAVKAIESLSRHIGDSKVSCAPITIEDEIGTPTLVAKAVSWVLERIDSSKKKENTSDYSVATNTGFRSAATNTGNYSSSTSTGDYSAATNTGFQSVATNTGFRSAATNTGNYSSSSVKGNASVAIATGIMGKARAIEGSAIVLCHRDEGSGEIIHIRASKVGENGVKANTWYSLDRNGEFFEVKQ